MKYLYFIIARILGFLGCRHKWSVIKETLIVEYNDSTPVGTRFTLQCRRCGDLKFKRVMS
jgi:hypothetical protein